MIGLKGNINHAACRWCYNNIPMEQFLDAAKAIGLKGIDLLGPDEWQLAIDKGMTCSMSTGDKFGITKGFNDPSLHQALYDNYANLIPKAADLGIKNIICFSGNRNGLSDEDGLINCAKGLKRVVKLAQQHGVAIVMELLNSKVNHPDYQCDRTPWGAALCEMLGSDHFKLLYDIYHMQIMEGDVIRTIRDNAQYLGHYHTGGNPGRNEIDESQELNYTAISQAIAELGFDGYFAHEFIPLRDPMTSLRQAVRICTV
jgi:hydroxypyruvate isomerase